MKSQRRIVALLLALCLLMFAAPALAEDGGTDVIRVGWFPLPGMQETHDGAYAGYSYDYLMEIAKHTGWTYEFVEADFPTCADMLERGEIDLLGCLLRSEERATVFDFPQLEYGHSYTTLFTAQSSGIPSYGFEQFNGLNIGVISDAVNKDYLAAFALENGFQYQTAAFDSIDALMAAVSGGEVDAGILGVYTASADTRILAEFAPLPYYFATTKGNGEVLVGLNRAMNTIRIEKPYLELELYQKYFAPPESMEFTSAELAFIKASKSAPIPIGIIPGSEPNCFWNEEESAYVGIYMELLRALSEKTGLQFDYVPLDLTKSAPIVQLKGGYPAVVATILKTQNFENDRELFLSDPLAVETITVVGRKGYDFTQTPADKTIAVMTGFQVALEYTANQFPEHRVHTYDTLADCMNAVVDGRADATVHLESCLNYLLQNPHYETLERNPAFVKDVDICMVVLADGAEPLMGILNKGLNMISSDERNDMTMDYTIMNPYHLRPSDVLYKYRLPLAIIVVLLVIVIAVLLLWVGFRSRSEKRLKEAYEQKEIALQLAEKASEAKGRFMSRISHEIRTPLNAVIGYNSIARSEISSSKGQTDFRQLSMKVMSCLEKSDVASRHLLTIINDVLDMASIESGRILVAHESFDFRSTISSLTTLFYMQAKASGVAFEVVFDNLLDEWFVGDQMRVNQILTNLLGNAVKFTPAGGSVKLIIRQLEADAEAAQIRFEIADTGIGMSPEYLQHIWVPFEQADPSISRRYGGTGLGLSITKSLVDLMGGTISVESEPDRGTRFFVDLRLERTEQPELNRDYDLSGIHALVVDDDISTCEYMQLLFDRCGVRCETVASGADALRAVEEARARQDDFTLCLLDWRMPEMDGLETLKRLQAMTDVSMPVIIVTAYDYTEIENEAGAVGVETFLPKPLFPSTLFDLLANISGKSLQSPEKANAAYDFSGARVLLAEDNRMNMEIAKRILTNAGLWVDSAWNGSEALAMFASSPPGTYKAILMDIQMPEMDGHEAAKRIRACLHPEAATIPIIAMTADAFAENVAEALASGMNDHVAKPIDVPTLLRTLQQHIHSVEKK